MTPQAGCEAVYFLALEQGVRYGVVVTGLGVLLLVVVLFALFVGSNPKGGKEAR